MVFNLLKVVPYAVDDDWHVWFTFVLSLLFFAFDLFLFLFYVLSPILPEE